MPERTESALFVVRHGDTEWSRNGRHTGATDLPLLSVGEDEARELRPALQSLSVSRVLCSPRRRARETCLLAGFSEDRIEVCADLAEWDYGDYEGLTSLEIRQQRPDWNLWRDGCPGGESPAQVSARADRVVALAAGSGGDVIAFAHGHILRVVAARWAGFDAAAGERLLLAPATVSKLGHEHATRVIEIWNAPAGRPDGPPGR
jgi:broad specificity phosphatase PhoE